MTLIKADEEIDNNKDWAFKRIRNVAVHQASKSDPFKWFILKSLQKEKIQLPSSASRRDWIRRLYYNLIGLPPNYSKLIALESDKRSDRELASDLVDEPSQTEAAAADPSIGAEAQRSEHRVGASDLR